MHHVHNMAGCDTDKDLAQVCRELAAKGLISDLGADDLGLYRPTIAGVQLVAAWLLRYVTYPPTGECPHE